MSNTKIKAAQFHGVVGHGTDGYFLMTNADGSMSWSQASTGPSVTSVAYPGDDTAADPAGGQTVVLTGTGFAASGMTVTIGGTTAPSVAHDSNTQLTITTPAKAAGDYDIVVTNGVTGASGTFVNGISYNGVPAWTTAAGSLGTFESETTISTITLQAAEPDGGTITFNITNGALPTGLSLTGANIDGTTTAESSTTLYSFTIEAIDDENQATPRNFSITVNSAELVSSENFTINTYTGNGSTQAIEGKIGTAADFNGSSSYITAGDWGIQGGAAHTVSFWVNFKSTAAQFVYGIGDTVTNFTHTSLRFDTSLTRAYLDNNGGAYIYSTSLSLSTGTWYYVTHTYDGSGTSELFIDGVSVGSQSVTLNIDGTAVIGRRPYYGSDYLNAKLDQFRVFNKKLSSSEITTLYGESNTSTTKSTTDIFDDGSGVALYEFEKGAIDTGVAIDSGQSASFVGTNQNYIQLPSGIDTILNTKNFGLSFWVKAPNAVTHAAFSTETTNSTFQIHANWFIAGAYALINGGGSDVNLGAVDSNWHHIVVTSDGSSSYKGYFDKVYKGASTYRQTSNVGTFLGAHPGGGFNLNGQIDQVRIFNRQLSQSDIDSLYNETAPSTVDYFSDGNGKALYKLDNTPDDESGSYDATWNGTAAYIDEAATVKYNGTPTNINFLGMAFQPDLVWVKNRFDINNLALFDSIRGREMLTTSTTNQGFTPPSGYDFTSFDSNGFTVAGSPYYININDLNDSMVAWCWKAGGAAVTNTDGTITSQVSANQDAGFSIVKYTGTFTSSTVGHGLSSTPEMIIVKNTDAATNWWVWTKDIGGADKYLKLNGTDVVNTATSIWNNTLPTSTVFSVANDGGSNGSGNEIIAYCFHSVDGYQKIGSYTGNGSATGPTVTTGFEPRFLLLKRADGTAGNWFIFDSARSTANERDDFLHPNSNAAETTNSAAYSVDFLSIGFQIKGNGDQINGNNGTYIYLAIA